MKKIVVLSFLFILFCTRFSFAQSAEGQLFDISSRVKIYLPATDRANLEGSERYIQIGLLGSRSDVDALVGYFDRFAVNDNDMITQVVGTVSEEMIDYYKFYLNPLYDANNFQTMLDMSKISKFFIGKEEHTVSEFSNTIYASIKSKK